MIGELFSKYQPGTKHTCLIIVILRQLHAVMLCSTLLRRRQSVILFRRLHRLVEVANRSICLHQRGIAIWAIPAETAGNGKDNV